MNSTSVSSTKTFLTLTPENVVSWLDAVHSAIRSEGTLGVLIVEGKNPLSTISPPCLDEPMYALLPDGIKQETIKNKYRYGLVTNDSNGKPVLVDGKVELTHSDTQLEAFQKSINQYKLDRVRLEKVNSKYSSYLNSCLSDASISIMKAHDPAAYIEALSDPVKLLKLIEITHKLSDNGSVVQSFNDVLNCKQTNFLGYPEFITKFHQLTTTSSQRMAQKPTTESEALLNKIWKCILINNIDKVFFQYVLQTFNSLDVELEFSQVTSRLMTYYKNAPSSIAHANAFQKAHKPKVEGKCKTCSKVCMLNINTITNKPFAICAECHAASKRKGSATDSTKKEDDPTKKEKKPESKPANNPAPNSASQAMRALCLSTKEDESDD